MLIKEISIKNFRAIKEQKFSAKDFSMFIGNNATGKTSVLEAINFALSPYFLKGRIKHTDFHNGEDKPITIELEFDSNFTAEIPDGYTNYHARRQLPGLTSYSRAVSIVADPLETRFMVLAPGGENPRPKLEPSKQSVGIRLTKRNQAIEGIQNLRADVFRFETKDVIGNRKPTSAWKSCFGARNYQPHIKLLRPGSEIDHNLTKLGEIFRSKINEIEFDRFQVRCGPV